MEKYLLLCRSNLSNLSQFKTVSIVIGNESCDLDSAVSAIVLAYVKYHEAQHQQAENDEAVIVLPVLNVPRQDLHLRREVVFWFEQVLHYDLKVLICRDEIDYDQLNASSADIVFSLVDHNENKEQARLLPRGHFEEIIDHHQPTFADGACQVTDQSRVLIDTTVGSCCSLVALRFLDCPLVSKFAHQEVNTDEGIALLLYGPILLDTNCFNHTIKRFNAKDYEAVNKLEVLLKYTPDAETSLFDRNEVYQRLVEAKNSLDGLSFEELLRKDMKMVESLTDNNLAICLPAIHGTKLTELSLKDQLDKLRAFSQNPPKSAVFSESRPRLFNAIVLLSVDNRIPNNLNRQLALYCENKLLMRTIATCLERNTELELEMITVSETLRIYNQNNLKATRKAVLPIISTILNGPGTQRPGADAAHATSLGSQHCSVNSAQPSALPNGDCRAASASTTASAHSQSTKRQVTFEISTAEVDPDYLMSFKTRTISVPEFEEFIRQHRHNMPVDAADTKHQLRQQPLDQTSQQHQQQLPDCPNSPENAKRSDSVGSDSLISHPSAPSSLIQQPDSYYGSYIEDSFVGDFVGDYMDPSNDHLQHENILVMDADGQNLVMMNPNEAISHSHEIEFDFDSFGPESIIYAGNVEAVAEKAANSSNNTVVAAPTNGENGHGSHHHQQQQQQQHREDEADNDVDDDDDAGKETSNGDDCNTSHTANKHDGATLNGAEEKRLPEVAPVPAVRTTVQRTTAATATTTALPPAGENAEVNTKVTPAAAEAVLDEESAELIVVADNSVIDISKTDLTTVPQSNGNHTTVNGSKTSEPVVEENLSELNIQNGNGTAAAAAMLVDESEAAPQSSLSPAPSSSFSRNSTLTRSQRKKVTPQVNIIKNMLVASSTYSPPVLDPTSIPSFPSNHDSGAGGPSSSQLNGDKSDVNENFIISSLAQKQQNEAAAHSEANGDHHHIVDHPLSISASASHNSLSEFGLNGGLTRQPSMKKKVPVNRDILLHNYDKDEEGEKTANSSDPLSQLNDVPYLNAAPRGENNGSLAAVSHSAALPPVYSADDVQMQADFGESFLNGHGEPRTIDMRVIEPYKKVISHGGYMHASADGRNVEGSSPAIIIFSACYMPDRTRADYHYVMDNLFMYVLTTLHNMIADDYILIYLHNGGQQNSGPTFGWLKRCYQLIDRRLKKNLKGLYILHPTFWLKTIIIMSKPFISSKFSRKLKFVRSLDELREMIPIEHVAIPEPVKIYDQLVTSR